jgi:hypothetical protein
MIADFHQRYPQESHLSQLIKPWQFHLCHPITFVYGILRENAQEISEQLLSLSQLRLLQRIRAS